MMPLRVRVLLVAGWLLATGCSSPATRAADAGPAAANDTANDLGADLVLVETVGVDTPTPETAADCAVPDSCQDPARHWCDPCSADSDCNGPGIAGAACVATPGEGRFCGTACASAADCPANAQCDNVVGTTGTPTRQCRPAAGALCSCSAAARKAHLPTFCSRSSQAGTCAGVRRCLGDGEPGAPAGGGLSACDAPEPVTEVCDAKDNNCDGLTDDGALCDDGLPCTIDTCNTGACETTLIDCSDGNPCTDDGCDAKGLCVHSKAACDDANSCTLDSCVLPGGCTASDLDGGACSAGIACTSAFCQGGVCVANPLGCDDGDACTVDSCAPSGGCTHVATDCDDGNACTADSCDPKGQCLSQAANSQPCSDGDPCTADACQGGQCVSAAPTCDDNNACTKDTCQVGVGCIHLDDCDDANVCTLDTCSAKAGCTHAAVAGCALALPYKQAFSCGDASLGAWTFETSAAAPLWAVDATPAKPAPLSGKCALNFNNGKDYGCPDGAASVQGSATGPLLDATGLAANAALVARFALSGAYEAAPWDLLRIDASSGGAWTTVQSVAPTTTLTWQQRKVDLSAYAGTKFRIRFVFSTQDCLVNDRPGPFVDDLRVGLGTCASDADCDDGNPCTADTCTAAGCTYSAIPGTCDDGNACTVSDACKSGACSGQLTTCNDGNACTIDSCDASGLACAFQAIGSGALCDDGIACTVGDACIAGLCAAQAACDDANSCTFDTCTTEGLCSHIKAQEGYPCSDGNPCTGDDACAKLSCQGSPAPCSVGWQDAFGCAQGGDWLFEPAASGSKAGWGIDATPAVPGFLSAGCSLNFNNGVGLGCDPLAATVEGTATSKTVDLKSFTSASLRLFSYLDVPKAAGHFAWIEVSDDDFATVLLRRWIDGNQKGWQPIVVDLGPVCGKVIRVRLRFAAPGCTAAAGAGWFVDDLALTTPQAAVCTLAADCDDANACTTDACDGGHCSHLPASGPCDDANVCTLADACAASLCVGGADNCDDNNACTADGCQPGIGCTHVPRPASTPCDDGDPCITAQVCFEGNCLGVQACDDGLPCTTDACAANGGCSHQLAPEGETCTDGDACTSADACVAGACKGVAVACKILTQFDFSCGVGSGWTWSDAGPGAQWGIDATPAAVAWRSPNCSLNFNNGNNIECLPGQDHVVGEATSPLIDLSGASSASLQFWSLADPSVDAGSNVRSILASTDGFQSTVMQEVLANDPGTAGSWRLVKLDLGKIAGKAVQLRLRFDSGGCQAGQGPGWFVDDLRVTVNLAKACKGDSDCDDGDACTLDLCASATCSHKALSGTPCDDGSVCTLGDACLGGLCIAASPLACDDANACSDDSCSPKSGCLHMPGTEKPCSDGSTCTVGDTCHGSICVGVPMADGALCADAKPCSDKGSCLGGTCVGAIAAASGLPCEDGDACTVSDGCQGGICVGAKGACDDGNPCTIDQCSAGLVGAGACTHKLAVEGTICDDGDACTAWDACLGSTCTGTASGCKSSYQDPFLCDDKAWILDPAASGMGWSIDNQPDPPGARSLPCALHFGSPQGYGAKVAVGGSAVSPLFSVPAKGLTQLAFWSFGGVSSQKDLDQRFIEVSSDGFVASIQSSKLDNSKGVNQWTRVTFNLSNWASKTVQVRLRLDSVQQPFGFAPGWFVDDLVVQTLTPTSCSSAAECPDDDNPCTVTDCIAAKCVAVAAANLACDDGNACTNGDLCTAGSCIGADTCDDGYACSADTCNPAQGCNHSPISGCGVVSLPDAVTFTCGGVGTDLWQLISVAGGPTWHIDAAITVAGGVPASCALRFGQGKDFSCGNGQLQVQGSAISPSYDATALSAGTPLVARMAIAGSWEAGNADNLDLDVTVDDGQSWTTLASYDGSASWRTVTVDLSAYAGTFFRMRLHFWTQDCSGNSGTGPLVQGMRVFVLTCGAGSDCDDANPCTDDACEPGSGTCTYSTNNATCNDGDACSANDVCAAGTCGGVQKTCSDANPCTDDSCDAASGACIQLSKSDGSLCNDGEPCTSGDACNGGLCKGTAKADGSACSDGNGCTSGDGCVKGVCVSKSVLAEGSLCTDSDPCTSADACKSGACVGKAACDDGNPCTTDQCEKVDALTKKCTWTPSCP